MLLKLRVARVSKLDGEDRHVLLLGTSGSQTNAKVELFGFDAEGLEIDEDLWLSDGEPPPGDDNPLLDLRAEVQNRDKEIADLKAQLATAFIPTNINLQGQMQNQEALYAQSTLGLMNESMKGKSEK